MKPHREGRERSLASRFPGHAFRSGKASRTGLSTSSLHAAVTKPFRLLLPLGRRSSFRGPLISVVRRRKHGEPSRFCEKSDRQKVALVQEDCLSKRIPFLRPVLFGNDQSWMCQINFPGFFPCAVPQQQTKNPPSIRRLCDDPLIKMHLQ